MESREGKKLTKLHGRDTWNKIASMTKDKCIEEITKCCVVKKSYNAEIEGMRLQQNEQITIGNVKIQKNSDGALHVVTLSGQMSKIHSVHPHSHPDLFKKKELTDELLGNDTYMETENTNICGPNGEKYISIKKYVFESVFKVGDNNNPENLQKKTKIVGLMDHEKNLLDVLETSNPDNDEELETINVDRFRDNSEARTLETVLKSESNNLLKNILNELKGFNEDKWGKKTTDDLFPGFLNDSHVLVKETNVKELTIIAMELWCLTGRVWQSANMLKSE